MENKTAEDLIDACYYHESETGKILIDRNDAVKVAKEYASLVTEEKDERIILAGEALVLKEKQLKASEEIYNLACKEIERLREALRNLYAQVELDCSISSDRKYRDLCLRMMEAQAVLSNQPVESAKDKRIKELEELIKKIKSLRESYGVTLPTPIWDEITNIK